MPYITQLTQPIQQFVHRLNTTNNNDSMPEGEKIKVCAAFQRGDDHTGVWNLKMQRKLVESILMGFPIGSIMLVKAWGAANSTNHFILDGGNRSRAMRDFMSGNFSIAYVEEDGSKTFKTFEELPVEIQAKFKNTNLHLQQIRVLREDPPDTVARMFTNTNTLILSLKDGELIKAHGWMGNIPIIELAKRLIGEPWEYEVSGEWGDIIDEIRENWYQTFPGGGADGTKRETKRCDNIAMMCGFILSSITSSLSLFTKKFDKIKNHLTPENIITEVQKEKLLSNFTKFIATINAIDNNNDLFKRECGMPKKTKIFIIWGAIVTDRMTPDFTLKVINFYNAIQEDEELMEVYDNTLSGGGDGHTTRSKLENVINLINSYDSN